MSSRQNGQHQRFSWQVPLDTHSEQQTQGQPLPQEYTQRQRQPTRIDTNIDDDHRSRTFSYAQTPAEHVAFQYIPSPSDIPAVPALPQSHSAISQPQITYHSHNRILAQAPPRTASPAPAYEEKPPFSPLTPYDQTNAPLLSAVSPIVAPLRTHSQMRPAQTQHARNMSNLSPINTKFGQLPMPPIPTTPHPEPGNLPSKTPITPISSSSIKKDPADTLLPSSRLSHAHEPYSPHGLSATTTNTPHAVFSPDSAYGPNGLDFALHQPGQITHPNMDLSTSGSTHEWKSSLCSCTPDISTCLTGLFCTCILYGRTSHRINQKSSKQDPTDLLSHKATNGHCIMMALSCGFWWLYPMVQRTRLRHMYKLEGGLGGDCIRGLCCCCCVAVQNEREIKTREEAKRQWAGPASSEVYKSPPQMAYAPQR